MKEQLTIISDDLNHGIITEKEARTKLLILFGVVESAFSFDDLEVWGSNSGDTGIVLNIPERGNESVYLKHSPSGKIGYVQLNV